MNGRTPILRWTVSAFLWAWAAPVATSVQGQELPSAPDSLDLATAFTLALTNRPEIEASTEGTAMASAALEGVRGTRWPTMGLQGSAVRFQEPMVVAPLHAFDPSAPPTFDATLLRTTLGAEYTLFDGGARSGAIRAAEALMQQAGRREAVAEASVLEATARAFVALRTARTRSSAAQAQVRAMEAEVSRVEQLLDVGAAARVEGLRAQAALARARAEQSAADQALAVAAASLARWTGMELDHVLRTDLVQPRLRPATVQALAGAATLAPEVEEAHLAAEAAQARADAAGASRMPRVHLTGGLLQYGSGAGDFTNEWQTGIRLDWPIFSGGVLSARAEEARAGARAADAHARGAELRHMDQAERASAAWTAAAERQQAFRAAVETLEEVARIEALALAEGAGLQRDLLSAEADLFSARSELAGAEETEFVAALTWARTRGALTRTWIMTALEGR